MHHHRLTPTRPWLFAIPGRTVVVALWTLAMCGSAWAQHCLPDGPDQGTAEAVWERYQTLCDRGHSLNRNVRHEDAATAFAAAAGVAEGSGDLRRASAALYQEGLSRRLAADPEGSLASFQDALRLAEAGGHGQEVVEALRGMAVAHMAAASLDQALERLAEAVGRAHELEGSGADMDRTLASLYFNRATILSATGRFSESQAALDKGSAYEARLDDPLFNINFVVLRGFVAERKGDFATALAHFRHVEDRISALPPGVHRYNAFYNAAMAADGAGSRTDLLRYVDRYRAELERAGDVPEEYRNRLRILEVGEELAKEGRFGTLREVQDVLLSQEMRFDERLNARMSELEASFDAERRENEIALLGAGQRAADAALSRQRLLIIALAACLLAVAAVGYVAYCRRRDTESLRTRAARQDAAFGERERIARELHDTLLQNFTAANLQMQRVADTLPTGGAARGILESTMVQADTALREARDAIVDFRTPAAADLPTLLRRVVGNPNFAPLSIELDLEPDLPDLGGNALREVRRIVAEALMNILKHAGVRSASVQARNTGEAVAITVEDHGTGFDTKEPSHGFGLGGMRERAALIGGKLAVMSSPDGGTRVELSVPVQLSH